MNFIKNHVWYVLSTFNDVGLKFLRATKVIKHTSLRQGQCMTCCNLLKDLKLKRSHSQQVNELTVRHCYVAKDVRKKLKLQVKRNCLIAVDSHDLKIYVDWKNDFAAR